MSMVQNGMVNTSTAVRPAPPPASAMVVAAKLIVVWKNPVTITAVHDWGLNGLRCQIMTANSSVIATSVRSML